MSWLMTVLLVGVCVEVAREVNQYVERNRPALVGKDETVGGSAVAADLPTVLERRLEVRIREEVAVSRPYLQHWSTCLHDFPRSAQHFDPFPGLPVALHECRDCGWVEGVAA